MSERDDPGEEDSFDDNEFLSTKPPPADVHNASTAVANLPTTLLDSLRSPHTKLDSASISELLATTLASNEPPPPPPAKEDHHEEHEEGLAIAESTIADLESLPLLDEPDDPLEDGDLALPLTRTEGQPVVVVEAAPLSYLQAQPVPVPVPVPASASAWSSRTLVLVTIAVGAALGVIGMTTWLVVGLFQ